MALKEYPGSVKKQDCYRIEHRGAATLWISIAEGDWLFGYSHFISAKWETSDVLIVFFSTHQIRITGRNLRPIVEALSILSLAQITLKFNQVDGLREGEPLIQKIEVIKLEE